MSNLPAWADGLEGLDGWEEFPLEEQTLVWQRGHFSIRLSVKDGDLVIASGRHETCTPQFQSPQAALDAANALVRALTGGPDPVAEAKDKVVEATRKVPHGQPCSIGSIPRKVPHGQPCSIGSIHSHVRLQMRTRDYEALQQALAELDALEGKEAV